MAQLILPHSINYLILTASESFHICPKCFIEVQPHRPGRDVYDFVSNITTFLEVRGRICTTDLLVISYSNIANQDKHIPESMSNLVTEMSIYMKQGVMSKEERNRKPKLVECPESYFQSL
jgi:hypothetical protein